MQPLRIYRASAGSGKTFTLAVEYITLLAVNPMEYQNILAVTFTNKATAEMKQRILSTLYGIGHGLRDADKYVEPILRNLRQLEATPKFREEPYRSALRGMDEALLRQRAKEALSNIIHDYSRFHVETIDSFFQSIVREIACELELPTKMKVELDETEVLGDAIKDIIDNLREGSNEFCSVIDFIEEKIRSNRSWQVEETVKEFGRNIFKENYLIHGEHARRTITDYGAIFQYRQLLKNYLEQQKQAVMTMGEKMLAAYEEGGMDEKNGTKSIVTFLQKVKDGTFKDPVGSAEGTFSTAIAQYKDDEDKWFKKTAKLRTALMPHVQQTLMPMLQELFAQYEAYLSHVHTVSAVFQHIFSLMLLNEISEKVKSLNVENNRFLLSETANFLRNVINEQDIPFIYEKTGAVIRHIMIDEFQDTSMLQWGNFKPLILNSLSMGGSCLIVGDVKQSIYRFRNSDWQILNSIEADEDLRGYMGEIPAEYNYRSSKRVVEFNNALFTNGITLLQTVCPALNTAYGDVRQKANKTKEAGFVRIENIDYHGIDAENLSDVWQWQTPQDYDEATLQRVQLSVKGLMEQGVSPNDITILIRTNREVALISDYFNAHKDVLDVQVVSDDAFRLDASPAINIIICALRALAAQDETLHLAALTYYYTQEPFGEEGLPQSFNQQGREDLRFKALTELVEDIYQIFRLDRLQGQDAYLFFFMDLLERFCDDHQADIDTFLQAWDEKLCEKTIPGGVAEGVRIMTMHKSKGLEFHSVIIPSCSWAIKPKDMEVMWCVPKASPYNQMPLLPVSVKKATDDSIFAADRREEELKTLVDNINVLYVAFTRAKHNLVILTGNKMGCPMEDDDVVDNAQAFLVKAMPDFMKKSDIEGIITAYQYGEIVPTVPEEIEKEKNVMACDYDALPVSFVSHPSVAEFRQSYESDMFITADSLDTKVQQHTRRIRLISLGNLYHSIFQLIRTADDVPRAISRLQAKGCFGSLLDAEEARRVVSGLIESIEVEHPEWFSPDWRVLNERAILSLKDGIPTVKRPDRVIVNGKRAIVIDYKTAQGVVKRREDGTLSVPSENVAQLKEYVALLKQLGFTDIEPYLWFILDNIVVPV